MTTQELISPAPPNHCFFSAVFGIVFFQILGLVPVFISDFASWLVFIGLILACFITSITLSYLWMFHSRRSPQATFIKTLVLLVSLYPFVFGIQWWGPLTEMSRTIPLANWFENLSAVFAGVVVITTTVVSYFIACRRSSESQLNSGKPINWTLFQVDPTQLTYGRIRNFPIIHSLYWPLTVFGLLYLGWYLSFHATHQHLIDQVKLIAISGLITMILGYIEGLACGECLRMIQLAYRWKRGPFYVAGQDDLVKWRHDYVKYHLPAPIRMLNLHLFNQHVEAYEQYLSTHKPKRKYRLPSH